MLKKKLKYFYDDYRICIPLQQPTLLQIFISQSKNAARSDLGYECR